MFCLPSVLSTEFVSNEARLPQCARQDAGCEPLCEEAVSNVTVVEFSETAIVSVEPIGSPPDLVLVPWNGLMKYVIIIYLLRIVKEQHEKLRRSFNSLN